MNVSIILAIIGAIFILVVFILLIVLFTLPQPPTPEPGPSPTPGPTPPVPPSPPKNDSNLCYYKSNLGSYVYLKKQISSACEAIENFTLVDSLKTFDTKKDDKMLKFCLYDASKTSGNPNNTYILSANYFSSDPEKCVETLETAPLVDEFYTYGSRDFVSKPLDNSLKNFCIYNYRDTYLKNVIQNKTTDICSSLDRYNSQSEISFIK
jgi:hypothetical protein